MKYKYAPLFGSSNPILLNGEIVQVVRPCTPAETEKQNHVLVKTPDGTKTAIVSKASLVPVK